MTRLSALLFATIVAFPTVLSSHDFGPKRALLLGETTTGWTALLTYTEPPGTRTERVVALFGDGSTDSRAVDELQRRALLGLQWKEAPDWSKAKRKIRTGRREGISVAVLTTQDRAPTIRLNKDPGLLPLQVLVKNAEGKNVLKKTLQPGEFLKL